MQDWTSHSAAEGGQSLLEFAVLMPITLLMLLVVLDLAMAVDRKTTLDDALREGARAAALGASETTVAAVVTNGASGLFDAGAVSVCYYDVDGNGSPGDFGDGAMVSIEYTYKFLVGEELTEAFGLGTPEMSMTPEAHVRLEQNISVAPEC